MTIEYTEFNGKLYARASTIAEWKPSHVFQAVYNQVYSGEPKQGKDGEWIP